jgi:hypothetical protein
MCAQESRMTAGFPRQEDGVGAVGTLGPDRWGIRDVPWLWGTRVKILFVIDGRVSLGRGYEFGLGLVLDTLRDRSFGWWLRFEVDVRRRDTNPAAPSSLDNFRFDQPGFSIDDYDQIWFFGDLPGIISNDPDVPDQVIEREENCPLSNKELRLVAGWMEHGGGVFAAGDHSLLGASMCSRIPRVRSMRKWLHAQGVPSFEGLDRHETLQQVLLGGYGTESDRVPQPIAPVYRRWISNDGISAHPLLSGEAGVIDRFPDHMHEGAVINEDDVIFDQPLGIPGYDREEYPVVPLETEPDIGSNEPTGFRPRPRVIAHGWTTHIEAFPRRFALISVYDGEPADIGRVVVDSTWHHWFSVNLIGFQDEAPGVYRGMQNYYRNVGLWLATPQQRASMLFAAVWGVVVGSQPGLFSPQQSVWDAGKRVVDVVGRTAPQCILAELVAPFLTELRNEQNRTIDEAIIPAAPVLPLEPMFTQAILGGIARQYVDLGQHHILEEVRGRSTTVDADAIRAKGLAGVADAQRELVAMLAETAANITARHDALSTELARTTIQRIPITTGPESHD